MASEETKDKASGSAENSFWFCLTLFLTLILVTLIIHAPTPVTRAWWRHYGATYSALWPQGWSFFADTADQQVLRVYRWSADTKQAKLITERHMSSASRWGFGREALGQLDDVLGLVARTPNGFWRDCSIENTSCIADAPIFIISDDFPASSLCGLVIVTSTPPWHAGSGPPAKLAKLAVTCQG